jgi:urocanate hydratase
MLMHMGCLPFLDMALHNVIGDSFRGATWVAIHNGGGTGWGEAVNGGFGMVLDGSLDADRRAKSMLHWDVYNGVRMCAEMKAARGGGGGGKE